LKLTDAGVYSCTLAYKAQFVGIIQSEMDSLVWKNCPLNVSDSILWKLTDAGVYSCSLAYKAQFIGTIRSEMYSV
jgi:hypothetical protein